jgi:hypothetical protein
MGVRYINRVDDPHVISRLSMFVRPEVLGGLAMPGGELLLRHSISEATNRWANEEGLLARWAVLPPDPSIPPVTSRSRILDLDVYRVDTVTPDATQVAAIARGLVGRATGFSLGRREYIPR